MLGVVSVKRRNPGGTWPGDMLDGLAFFKAQMDHGARVDGARALLVAAGGAGSAIALALLDAGVRELVVHDSDESRVADLQELLADHGAGRVTSGPKDPDGCDLVFNATPLGMKDDDPLPWDAGLLDGSMFVGDVRRTRRDPVHRGRTDGRLPLGGRWRHGRGSPGRHG